MATPGEKGSQKAGAEWGNVSIIFHLRQKRSLYAVPAEEGYNQSNRVSKSTGRKPSLWVPGSGSGSNFSYNPGAKTGMKLSGRFVPGQHMFEKSLPDTKEDLRKITKSEVERLFRALF